jgi:hypothetical protein
MCASRFQRRFSPSPRSSAIRQRRACSTGRPFGPYLQLIGANRAHEPGSAGYHGLRHHLGLHGRHSIFDAARKARRLKL